MTSVERVNNAYEFKPVDKVPLEYHPSTAGLYEHGDKLRKLFKSLEGDFEDYTDIDIKIPGPDDFDADGKYHVFKTDDWGVIWEEKIYGVSGYTHSSPLSDISKIKNYKAPPSRFSGANLKQTKNHILSVRKKGKFTKYYVPGLFERMIAIRGFEDTLADLYDDTHEINRLADIITEYCSNEINAFINADVDCINFGDDYGTQIDLILSRKIFKRFFMPRYKRLMAPVKKAGIKIHFHSCGFVWDLLEDFKEMGADSIWPQLSVYDLNEFSRKLRDLKLAAALHIDRAGVMTKGKPDDVKNAINTYVNVFRPYEGGSWFYVEIDNDFPYENIETLIGEIKKYR